MSIYYMLSPMLVISLDTRNIRNLCPWEMFTLKKSNSNKNYKNVIQNEMPSYYYNVLGDDVLNKGECI